MNKKILAIFLAIVFCFSTLGVFANEEVEADSPLTTAADDVDEIHVDEADADETDADEADADEADADEADADEADADEADADEADADEADADEADADETDADQVVFSKEDLDKIKEAKENGELDAKSFNQEIKDAFKNADTQIKQELLAELALVKEELQDPNIDVFVKGISVDFEKYDNVYPKIKEDRTLVPIRAIMETFDAQVNWDPETRTVSIDNDDIAILMTIDNNIATVNEAEITLDAAPEIENDRTMVPLRFVSESLKLEVVWEEESRTVVIEEVVAEETEEEVAEDTEVTEAEETDAAAPVSADTDNPPADYSDDLENPEDYYDNEPEEFYDEEYIEDYNEEFYDDFDDEMMD